MRRSLPLVASVALLAGCADTPLNVPLRALSSSGPVAFVCLGAPGDLEDAARPLSECSAERTSAPDDYTIPHLYALVTQLFTGEVAVIDLTTSSNALVDQNQAVPGTTFLPTGAQPTDIVATPGGMATFVASAQPGFEAIYAMPSNMIRGEGASLTDWPSCALPVAPGKMLIGIDEADASGATRYSCDADYGASDPDEMCEGSLHCHGDLSVDAQKAQRPGR